ncbi:hypothetical protein [Paludisphaera soli]|uniref:hypothetical protein n=1 Tax=Paludisphaera soli TaxID=2712865 RepID=UPI0013E9A355|nr:hypothetical protein [Paludisphaera soli]
MKALARAVITAVYFLDHSDDDVVDPDEAVRALEAIGHELQGATEAEHLALREALDELIREQQADPGGSAEIVAFCRSFMDDMGLQGD